MLKAMAMALLLVAFQGNPNPKTANPTQGGQAPPAPIAPIPIKQHDAPTLKNEGEKHVNTDVKVAEMPEKDLYDKALAGALRAHVFVDHAVTSWRRFFGPWCLAVSIFAKSTKKAVLGCQMLIRINGTRGLETLGSALMMRSASDPS